MTSTKTPPTPLDANVQSLASKAPPRPAPHLYQLGEDIGNSWTYFGIVFSWLMSLVVAFLVGGAVL